MHHLATIRDASHPNPAAVYLARLAPGSRRAQAGALEWLAREASGGELGAEALPWHELRYAHTQALRARLTEAFAPRTVNRHLCALRGVLAEAFGLGLMAAEDYHRAAAVKGVKARRLPAGRALDPGEVLALFQRCARDGQVRDAALLALLFGAGLRRGEAADLTLADYDRRHGTIRIRHGKGDAERLVPLAGGVPEALDAWIRLRGEAPGPLLCPVRGGKIEIRRLSEQSIYFAVRQRGRKASVDDFSPHDARRTYITTALDAGADLAATAALAGHSQVTTTARYDRRGERAAKKAAKFIRIPYVWPGPITGICTAPRGSLTRPASSCGR